jgi:ribosomal protein S18 acetylase RimI-like enzyme
LENKFWAVVAQDYCDYYFFIYDWKLQRDKTRILLAFDGDEVVGLAVIYNGNIAQLRGSLTAVEFLLQNLPAAVSEVQVPQNCHALLAAYFPVVKLKEHVSLMRIKRGEEHLCVAVPPEWLTVDDAEEVAQLMRDCYPEMWGDMSADYVRQQFHVKGGVWVGIRQEGRLAAFGHSTATPMVGHVTWIATHPKWRRRGYASSLVSALTQQCLKAASAAIIYVVEDNAVARGIYGRVGFRDYRRYVFVKI